MGSRSDALITLGSASPRRAALLGSLGVAFTVETVELDEDALVDTSNRDLHRSVERIAAAKFAAFSSSADQFAPLLTADTLVACGNDILGKPASNDQLVSMLNTMSGQDVTIATAVCFGLRGDQPSIEVVTTTVRLRRLSNVDIAAYVATGTGMDKAGGLALQAEAGRFIDRIQGCWANVLGLPLCAVSVLLDRELGERGRADERCSVDLCGTRER